jgi:hypothetical protein
MAIRIFVSVDLDQFRLRFDRGELRSLLGSEPAESGAFANKGLFLLSPISATPHFNRVLRVTGAIFGLIHSPYKPKINNRVEILYEN